MRLRTINKSPRVLPQIFPPFNVLSSCDTRKVMNIKYIVKTVVIFMVLIKQLIKLP